MMKVGYFNFRSRFHGELMSQQPWQLKRRDGMIATLSAWPDADVFI